MGRKFVFVFVLAWGFGGIEAASSFEKIKALISPMGAQVGLSIRKLNGTEVFSYRSTETFPPASVAKLVSSACSLDVLNPSFRFQTKFGYVGSVKDGVLSGDLVIQGSGDPSFVIEDLREAIETLRVVEGLQEIRGNLIFDTSYLESPSLSISEEFNGDQGRAFTAELSAIPFNFNAFAIWASVSPEDQVRVEMLPRGGLDLKILPKVKMLKSGPTLVSVDYRPEQGLVSVSGGVSASEEPKGIYRSVPNPYDYLARVFAYVWMQQGGKWSKPQFKIETKPLNAKPLFSHPSRTVSRLLMDINKLSTNFGAELVLLRAGAQKFGLPAGMDKSRRVLEECLKKFGMNSSQMMLENASGLSRKSGMQPAGLSLFLSKMPQTDFYPEYLVSLSTLGLDGTMAKRLKDLAGKARLKSGSLQGVTTLAGYVFPSRSEPLSMALFFRCPSCDRSKLFDLEDKILRNLLEVE